MSLRTDLNTSDPNRKADAIRDYMVGDALGLALQTLAAAAPTQTIAGIVAGTTALATVPTQIFVVNGTVGASTGIKTMLKGPISGGGAVVPPPGYFVWDGATGIQFNATDAITTATFLYSTAVTRVTSLGNRLLGQTP